MSSTFAQTNGQQPQESSSSGVNRHSKHPAVQHKTSGDAQQEASESSGSDKQDDSTGVSENTGKRSSATSDAETSPSVGTLDKSSHQAPQASQSVVQGKTVTDQNDPNPKDSPTQASEDIAQKKNTNDQSDSSNTDKSNQPTRSQSERGSEPKLAEGLKDDGQTHDSQGPQDQPVGDQHAKLTTSESDSETMKQSINTAVRNTEEKREYKADQEADPETQGQQPVKSQAKSGMDKVPSSSSSKRKIDLETQKELTRQIHEKHMATLKKQRLHHQAQHGQPQATQHLQDEEDDDEDEDEEEDWEDDFPDPVEYDKLDASKIERVTKSRANKDSLVTTVRFLPDEQGRVRKVVYRQKKLPSGDVVLSTDEYFEEKPAPKTPDPAYWEDSDVMGLGMRRKQPASGQADNRGNKGKGEEQEEELSEEEKNGEHCI